MITKTTKAVRQVGGAVIYFNDKLKDGRRSLKVWNWTEDQ